MDLVEILVGLEEIYSRELKAWASRAEGVGRHLAWRYGHRAERKSADGLG